MNMRDDLTLHLDTKTSTDHFYYYITLRHKNKYRPLLLLFYIT